MTLQEDDKLIVGGGDDNIVMIRLNIPSNVSVKPNAYSDNSLIIFPNPAKDYLNFKTEKRFEIFDIQGRSLLKSEKSTSRVNICHLKAGLYFIKFEDNTIGKFVKE
jgi:hypothetical protein